MNVDGYRPIGKTASHANLPQLRIITPKAKDGFGHAASIRNKGTLLNHNETIESQNRSINKSANFRVNDFLEPVQDLRHVHRFKFDPDSPLFTQACANLQVDRRDIIRRKLKDFKAEVMLE